LTLDTFNEVLLGGVVLGSLYALMATGLALVWTTLGIFNFAHGTFIALGAYFAWQIASSDAMGAGLLVGALTSIVGMFVVGVLAYYLLIKPFERSPDIVVKSVITTLAGATILENSINLVWGPRNKQLDAFLSGDISFFGLVVSRNEAAIVVISLIILAGLGLFLQRAPLGWAMRAVAQNREAAQLMGIDVTRLYAMSFGLSAALAVVPLQRDATVLFHAAAGGVGLLFTQWARALDVRVIGTVSSDAKAAAARQAGCVEVIDYTKEDFVTRVRELTGREGVTAVFNSIGRDTFLKSLEVLRPRGTLVAFGQASGSPPAFDLFLLAAKALHVTWPGRHIYTASREELETSAADLFAAIGDGVLNVGPTRTYALDDIVLAHRDLESRQIIGAAVIEPSKA
jgi:branched-chain amino acid transport system permease protein